MKRFLAFGLSAIMMLATATCAPTGNGDTDTPQNAAAFGDRAVVVYGAALDEAQQDDTYTHMDLPEDMDPLEDTVGSADIERYLGLSNVSDSVMISSVAVVGNEDQSVRVKIATPENITRVEDHQYENAAITAGIANVDIIVSAISPVTGQSALTGVYKAAEASGMELDDEKLQIGADELDAVVDISDGMSDEESKNLTDAIREIKVQISDSVILAGNNNISTGDIQVIINNVFNQFNINISDSQQQQLLGIFERFNNSLTPDDAALITSQLRELGEQVRDTAQDFFAKAEESGLMDKIGQFFRDLWQWAQGLFD